MSSKNLKEQYDVIIIGNGIASKVFLFSFLKRFSDRRVLVIESPLYPACSIKTTSHVAVAQAVEGSGPLGQLVVDSYLAFRQFFEIYSPKGVEKGHLNPFWRINFKKILQKGLRKATSFKMNLRMAWTIFLSHQVLFILGLMKKLQEQG